VDELGTFVRACKSPPPAHRLDEPVALWREREVLDGVETKAAVAILRTRGCYWSLREGCAMCGYFGDTVPGGVAIDALAAQWRRVLRHIGDARYVKLYTSGSFLDPHEVPREFATRALADLAAAGVAQVLVESLPEFVQPRLLHFPGAPRLEIAIGLESATPLVLDRCVNKRLTWDGFERACAAAHDSGARVKGYLLLKPPFLTEGAAIADAVASARRAAPHVDSLSLNPVNVQRRTVVERLWRRGEWTAPWLWSVVEVLYRCADLPVRLYCDPTGGGTRRGAHNCGDCDQRVLAALTAHRLGSGEPVGLACDCRARWEALVAQGPRRRDGSEPMGLRRGFADGRGY